MPFVPAHPHYFSSSGQFPHSGELISSFEKEYPFTDMKRTISFLESIIALLKIDRKSSNSSPNATSKMADYRIGAGLLDQIAIAAAAVPRGNPQAIRLVIDLAEILGYSPTEVMYESAALAFAKAKMQDHHVIAVLTEMEGRGLVVSKECIRAIARQLQ